MAESKRAIYAAIIGNFAIAATRDAAVQRLEKAIREKHKDIKHIFIEAKSLSDQTVRRPNTQ